MSLCSTVTGQTPKAKIPSNIGKQLEVDESQRVHTVAKEHQNEFPVSIHMCMAGSQTHDERRIGKKHMRSGVGSYFCKYLKVRIIPRITCIEYICTWKRCKEECSMC